MLSDGTPVPRAQIIVVGRRFEQGPRPALVFVREEASDAVGVAEFKVPFGNYEVLVMNPRQGQTGSQRMVVDIDQTGNIAAPARRTDRREERRRARRRSSARCSSAPSARSRCGRSSARRRPRRIAGA